MNNDRNASRSVRAAIYCRISRDREGAGLGVDRQEADCRELADRLGWEVVGVYVDNDISAASGKVRPRYQSMLAEVRAGHVNGVLTWHNDRLVRRVVDLEHLIQLAESNHFEIQTVRAGDYNLATPTGRMIARNLVNLAQYEVEHTRDRIRSKRQQLVKEGKYRGGPRPYGYNKDGLTIREKEADVVREATEAVLAGRSLANVAQELNKRGLRTSTGKPWTYARLRDVLVRPRNAGLLHTGRWDRGTGEIVGPAVWPAIVDEEKWRRVHTLLTDPSRRMNAGNVVKWLGSGIYRCGKCGGALRPAPTGGTPSRGGSRRYLYRCVESAHLTVSAEPTDEYVRDYVAVLLRKSDQLRQALAPSPVDLSEDRAHRAALVLRLQNFEDDYAAGRVTGEQMRRATAKVQAELHEVDERMAARLSHSAASPILNAVDPGQTFLDSTIDIQRAVVRAVAQVTIEPRIDGMTKWSAERVGVAPAS